MLLSHYIKKLNLQIVIKLLLCIITLGRAATVVVAANLVQSAPNAHPSPQNYSPITRSTQVVPNLNPISTVATLTIPPQIISTTPAPFSEYDNQPLHQTIPPPPQPSSSSSSPAPPASTTTTTAAATAATTSATISTMSPPSTVNLLSSRPGTNITPIPPQERHLMSNMETTTAIPPDEYTGMGTTSHDSLPFQPNKSYDDPPFMSANSEPFQQPPAQPQDGLAPITLDVRNFGRESHSSLAESPSEHQAQNNFAQPQPNSNEHHDINQPIIPVLTQEQPSNVSQTTSRNFVPSGAPLEVIPTQNSSLPLLNSSLSEARDMNKQTDSTDVSQTFSEGRSDSTTVQPSRPTTPPISNTVAPTNSSSSVRKHHILKPKSKLQCTQESDCNNGACFKGMCFCEPGFTGDSCNININECLQAGSQPCANNGTCVDDINSYSCVCQPGFRGDRCQDLADMCNDSPCKHGAKCINHRTSYTCQCEPGYEGNLCEINIDDCLKNPCENDATCQDLVNGYKCECQQGFTGQNCEINVDDCDKNLCQNNATCHDLTNDYECHCKPGFSGKNCEENIDECLNMPCRHGVCTDLIDAYSCKCNDGYTGTNCDQDIDECNGDRPVCQNGGTCINTEGSFKCSCKEGFTGKECSAISDFCKARQPCKNGNCKNINPQKGLYQCHCYSGYLGAQCERKRTCEFSECNFDHAHCVSNVTCACLPGRREERTMCEYVTSCEQVEGDLCLHGGKCKNLEQGGYHCTCQDPWFGPVCQFQAETQFDAILLVVITCVGFLLAACAVVSLVIFRSVRKARATRGTYSPSTQEKFGNSASDLLKPPVPERLI